MFEIVRQEMNSKLDKIQEEFLNEKRRGNEI